MKLIEIKNTKASKSLEISYTPSDICNYKCWYCFPGCNNGVIPWPDIDIVKKNMVYLINYYRNNQNIEHVKLVLGGGEPTLWPDIEEFLDYVITNTNCEVKIMTNGSRTLRWWKEYGYLFNNVSVSIHHEQVDVTHIIELTKILIDKNVTFGVNVLMDHTAWDKCVNIVNELKSSGVNFSLSSKPVYINGEIEYTMSQSEYVLNHKKGVSNSTTTHISLLFDDGSIVKPENENYPIIHSLNNFVGWNCTLGVNYLFISFNGCLTGTCGQYLFGKRDYYSINDENFIEVFNPVIEPVICRQLGCHCAPEVVLNKRRI